MLVRIKEPHYGGGFATAEGAGEIPFTLPGELVQLTKGLPEIVQVSRDRVLPGCVHFGACGGCHYQHASYPIQLELKRTILTQLLQDAGIHNLPAVETISAEPWGYRNRIRLRIERDASGGLRAGYSVRGSNAFLPVRMCPIAAPILWKSVEIILDLARSNALVQRWLMEVAELELFTNADESKLQLTFYVSSAEAGKRAAGTFGTLCETLRNAVPSLAGAEASLDPDHSRRERRLWAGIMWGAAGLSYSVNERAYWVPREAFFQVNRFLIDRLVALVTADRSGKLAWDLYAGVGLFTRVLAERFDAVIAVEVGAPAAESLAAMARTNGKIEVVHSPTLNFLRAQQLQRERPDLVVVDPPRAGIGVQAATILARIAPPEIVYASCDPGTLARDLRVLTQAGYRCESVTLIDLFPQTFHMETVVRLRRCSA